jgi:hypothetical protein
MVRLPSLQGEIAPLHYAALAPALILSQHLAVALAFAVAGAELGYDAEFWALPLRRLASLPGLSAWAAALAFAFSLAISWQLALLSFRRASRSGGGHVVAALAAVPGLQVLAVAVLALIPPRSAAQEPEPELEPAFDDREAVGHVIQGTVAGMAIIVFAVLISAVTFGAYGWGLFVMTPFLVGVTTAYLANRRTALEPGRTLQVVLNAAALGAAALVAVALEGIVCILMAAPLGAAAAAAGGAVGRAAALAGHRRGRPLLSLAVLPALFALDGTMPPAVAIATDESIEISAPPSAVWDALTSDDPIAVTPGMVAQAGLAYPVRGRLLGKGSARSGTASSPRAARASG